MKTGDRNELNRRLVDDEQGSDHEEADPSPKKGAKEGQKGKQGPKSIPLCGFFKIR